MFIRIETENIEKMFFYFIANYVKNYMHSQI